MADDILAKRETELVLALGYFVPLVRASSFSLLLVERSTTGKALQCPVVHVKRAKPRDLLTDIISQANKVLPIRVIA